MKKFLVGFLVVVAFTLVLTNSSLAGAHRGRAGYAVRDDNAMKEIVAIKQGLRSMERDIKDLQSQQARSLSPIEQGKIEGRLTWVENQINILWKWVIALAIIVGLMVIGILVVLFSGKKKKSQASV
jgi:hypothetical protein